MMELDETIKPFVPDYPLYVIDMGHDKDLIFGNRSLDELRDLLSSIYSDTIDSNEKEIENSISALAGILTGDENLYFTAKELKGGKQKMCEVAEKKYQKIRAEVASEYEEKIAKQASEITKQASEITKQASEITKQDSEIARQASEIARLKALLADNSENSDKDSDL